MTLCSRLTLVTSVYLAVLVLGLTPSHAAQVKAKRKKQAEAAAPSDAASSPDRAKTEATKPDGAGNDATHNSPATPDSASLARVLDQAIERKLAELKQSPGPLASDAEFLRRVCLDVTGIIPSADKAAAFLESKDPDKRARLIDELLDSPDFGRHLADIWQDLLLERDSTNRLLPIDPLVDWLADGFNSNKPWDKLVAELLTVTGTQDDNGAATFFIANRTPDKLNDKVCQLFLGVSLQCAQCHNHPFASWKREEYWGMASFFTKVRAGGKKVGKGPPENVNEDAKGRGLPLPDSALSVAPKFLGGDEPKLDASQPYRPALAAWLCAAENPFFAKAMVNRMWAHFFSRGLVNPVDGIDNNPASHPELFETLARQFAASGFDLKFLVRTICNSQAYQRTSIAADESAATSDSANDDASYSRMVIKSLSAEQMYDSLALLLGATEAQRGRGRKAAGGKAGPASGTRAEFVAFFQAAEGADPTEYPSGIPQVLRLMNSPQMNGGKQLVKELVESARTPAANIERLYLATLSRQPSDEESDRLVSYVERHDVQAAYGDILWAMLNSSEFTLNH